MSFMNKTRCKHAHTVSYYIRNVYRLWCFRLVCPFPKPKSNRAHLGLHISLHPPMTCPELKWWLNSGLGGDPSVVGRSYRNVEASHTAEFSTEVESVMRFFTLILSLITNPDLHELIIFNWNISLVEILDVLISHSLYFGAVTFNANKHTLH